MNSTHLGRIAPLAEGFGLCGSPHWFEGLLWMSDAEANAVHTVTLRGSITTLPLPGHTPCGLGFRPDGSLLIASSEDRQVLRYDGETITTLADLCAITRTSLGDMAVDGMGRAFVSCPGDGLVVRIDPDGSAVVTASGLEQPAGLVVTTRDNSLIVAEAESRRLVSFAVDPDGTLSDRRVFAEHLSGPPSGIALDPAGGVWVSTTAGHQFERIAPDGTADYIIELHGRRAIACAFGGPGQRVLFLVSTADGHTERAVQSESTRLDAVTVEIPRTEPV
jgi:sugar lactone lactonase YvrE